MQQTFAAEHQPKRWWHRRRPASPPSSEQIFLDHLDLVERAATSVARRSGFPSQDVEDFVSTVKVKLIEDDYQVIRRHRGDSSMSTYLATVVHHAFKDWRQQKWGRYRPSAKAKRLGPVAVQLEQLLVRDQLPLSAAVGMLQRRRAGSTVSESELRQLAAQLPPRTRRTMTDEEALAQQPSPESSAADRRVEDAERRAVAERAAEVLSRLWRQLPADDRLLLQMHYRDGCKISTIARTLGCNQRSLYTRRDRNLGDFRRACEAEGLTWDGVREILGWGETPLIDLMDSGSRSGDDVSNGAPKRGKPLLGPSKKSEGGL